jgi:hypothetical protein
MRIVARLVRFALVTGCSSFAGNSVQPVIDRDAAAVDGATMGLDSGTSSDSATSDAGNIREVDLRSYFPAGSSTRSHRRYDSSYYARYTTFPASPDFQRLYDLYFTPTPATPGNLFVWQKAYYSATSQPPAEPCVATYAHLFFGADKSITEAGDYLSSAPCTPSIVFGYQKASVAAGLLWSGAGGLVVGAPARAIDIEVAQRATGADPYQVQPGYRAYSHVELLEVLPTFSPRYGNAGGGAWRKGGAKTYTNVARIVFHHGVRVPNQTIFKRCAPPASVDEYTRLYRSEPQYDSYASEYYLAPGVGIVQEGFVYNEHNEYFGAGTIADCTGAALVTDRNAVDAYLTYIDDP